MSMTAEPIAPTEPVTVADLKTASGPPSPPAEPPAAPSYTVDDSSTPLEKQPTLSIDPAISAKEAEAGKKFVPFIAPAEGCTPAAPATLTPEQNEKYASLLEHMKTLEEIPEASGKNASKRALDDTEKQWLTRECLLRYLRAAKWNLAAAKTRVVGTLVWRREYGVYTHTAEYISPENETGKQYILGYDNEGRPCHYLNPARQNTKTSERQVQHLVWMLERVIDLMPPGQESLALLINFKSSSSGSNPSISTGKEVLGILQNHYPERLGRALIINIPWFVWGFFKLINPFIDPLTREKLKFNEDLRIHVPPAQLDVRLGGDCAFEYDHTVYWPELDRICSAKRKAIHERWLSLGGEIGASEAKLKGASAGAGVDALTEKVEALKVEA